jgi:Tol biopolymer transport system component
MSRIADVLELESQTVDLEQGDFERLLGRRERKERNRRIRAGALGVIVVLATGIVLVRSLTSERIPADPPIEPRPKALPAAAGTLAYVLDGDIYVADPDGSNAVRIADGLEDDDCISADGFQYSAEGPMWSPDGRYLAYRQSDCSNSESSRRIVISDAEGNVLATFPGQGWQIAWSPDATRVAVWDRLFETIGVYGLDGARQTQLTMPSGWAPSGDQDPVWMPDGASLLVESVELPLDGGTPRPLPLPGDMEDFSPDGSHVAYVTGRSLTVARSDGSEPRVVFGRWGGFPTWSPTGDRIAFTTRGPGDAWSAELRVLDVATGSVTLLTEAERGSSIWVIGFSPQGDRILFSRTEDEGAGEGSLWSIRVDGSSDARLLVTGTMVGEWLSR